mmetsp:Transcript_7799/g.35361  ORF Transcript_7799/g.35361 Transcript_7799/m.35361 type:complete len:215 (-) Transcript_7799:53-697(-)
MSPTAIPFSLRSHAMVTPAMFTAALLTRYGRNPPLPLSPHDPMSDEMIAIFPPGAFTEDSSALDTRTTPTTFTSKARDIAATSRLAPKVCCATCSSHVCPGAAPRPPALFTSTSTRTDRSARYARSESQPASVHTSTPVTTPPLTPTASSSGEELRQAAYTTSPLAVSCRQSSRPMPELQPVITTWAMTRVKMWLREKTRDHSGPVQPRVSTGG